jgi:predicted dehydrogenase/threonine dehydrogenase-like Zn-dependent dehydrogenase
VKQLLHRFDSGELTLANVPVPAASGAQIVVETRASIVSAGTERMLVDFGRAGWLEKARRQPEKVRQVLDKLRTDGVGPTIEAVRAKLEQPVPLGYCEAGVVVEVGPRASASFAPGDRVVTNGPHSEYVRVPATLAARIPDGVSFESAAFTPLAAIALQGLRLANPTLGETVVVYGLGLIGLLAVQLARANGCRVIGIDRDAMRCELGRQLGADAFEGGQQAAAQVMARTGGVGADIVLLTLASPSNEPMHQAAEMSRRRGRLVLVGVTGLELRREDFYKKELSFAVSCSYGPGRYDPTYEEQGQDYPIGFVRWTEQRNFEAVLDLMADGRLDPRPLISHRFDFAEAERAYDVVTGSEPSLGVVLGYPDRGGATPGAAARTIERMPVRQQTQGRGTAGVIGAGNYATRILIPAMRDAGFHVRTIASSGGTSGAVAAEKFDAERATTDLASVFDDPEIDTIFIVTRHDTHASLTIRALNAGKNVFVEKPLALTDAELREVEQAAARASGMLTVGFNRRFAPLTVDLQSHLAGRAGPLTVIATVNAGATARDQWTQDPDAGGGRIVGEAVHWIDLARALAGSPIQSIQVGVARTREQRPLDDIAHLTLSFVDGSTAVVHYLASGAKAFPKERIECFFDGRTFAIDNWRRLRRFGVSGPMLERPRAMNKGQREMMQAWRRAVLGGRGAPIPLDELLEVSHWAMRAAEMARSGGGAA